MPSENFDKVKLLHQSESNSKLWQAYMNEARPHILNKLIVSFLLMINFSRKGAHQHAFVFMDSFASHCCVSYVTTTVAP